MIRRPPRSTQVAGRRQRQMCIRDSFLRSLKKEEVQVRILKKLDLYSAYIAQHYDYHMQNWYLKKLELVPEGQRSHAAALVQDIRALYDGDG